MALKSFKGKAPGSLMLFGEHAVLRGELAIVTSVPKFITVTLIPRSDNVIQILSKKYGNYQTKLTRLTMNKKFQFVLTAIKNQLQHLKTGFTLKIVSEFPADIGFGSSAAVTVATLRAILAWRNKKISEQELAKLAIKIVREVQKIASGGDALASVYDKVICYRMNATKIRKFDINLPIIAVYSGSKMPTVEVIKRVKQFEKKHPKVAAASFKAMGQCSEEAEKALVRHDLSYLGELMNIHQGLQEALGISNAWLNSIVYELRSKSNILGAKISGSGLGDCVIGLEDI